MNTLNNPVVITDWNSLRHAVPENPLNAILLAKINSSVGTYLDSGTFIDPPSGWTSANIFIASKPVLVANYSSNEQKVAEANQWNFEHLTWNDDPDVAPPVKNIVFLRCGSDWINEIKLNTDGQIYNDIQISFSTNAATRGDNQATIPVISFTGEFSGDITLALSFKFAGSFNIMLRMIDAGSNWSAFEIMAIVVNDKIGDLCTGRRIEYNLSDSELDSESTTSAGGAMGPVMTTVLTYLTPVTPQIQASLRFCAQTVALTTQITPRTPTALPDPQKPLWTRAVDCTHNRACY